MKAVQVKCPQCGATLKAGDDPRVICEYCGTEAHVQRRSRVLERVLPPPVRIPDGARVALQVRTASWAAIGVVFSVIAVGVVAVTCVVKRAVKAQQAATTRGGGTTATPGRTLGWEGDMGGGMLIADADGDGDDDVIGRCREYGPTDAVSIIALDGETGATIWESAALGNYIETYQGTLTLAPGGLIVFASERAVLSAFAANGGKPAWTAKLSERVEKFCAGDATTIVALGTDEVRRPLRLADGTPAPEPPRADGPACEPLPHDHEGGHPRLRHLDAPYELADQLGLQRASLVVGPGGRVAAGERSKGTRVAQLAGLAADDGGAARWKVDVPPDPLAAHEGAPELVVVGDDVACASYELSASHSTPRVTCFELADGKRRWDVELLDDSPLEGLFITASGVMIAQWGLLEVRDPATGALRWKFGGV